MLGNLTEEHLNQFMGVALEEAKAAFDEDEVPIGAVVLQEGKVVSKGHNAVEQLHDASAHAEVLALRGASEKLGRWRLDDVVLFTTVEPCTMCASFIKLARVPLVVFGANDLRMGALGTLYDIGPDPRWGHAPRVVGGVRSQECAELVSRFFEKQRSE